MIQRGNDDEADDGDVGDDEGAVVEGGEETAPAVEHDEENAKYETVGCTEELAGRTIRILFVVTVESGTVFERNVLGCSFDAREAHTLAKLVSFTTLSLEVNVPMEKPDVARTDDSVHN